MHGPRLKIWILVVLVAFVLAFCLFVFNRAGENKVSSLATRSVPVFTEPVGARADTEALPLVLVGDVSIPVEVRQTPAELQKGLSGRPHLDANEGMFFVFKTKARHNFWMPDMNFPIDIVWITGGKVVDIDHNVTNVFDPKQPVYYQPVVPVDYVLEVNAGFMKKNNLTVGSPVKLLNI